MNMKKKNAMDIFFSMFGYNAIPSTSLPEGVEFSDEDWNINVKEAY